jgi:hypothetical protein
MMNTATTHQLRQHARHSSDDSADPRVAALERRLQQTEIGRDVLRLLDRLSEARIVEQLTGIGLDSAEQSELSLRERLREAEARQTAESIGEVEALRVQLLDAEIGSRRWRRALVERRSQREHVEAELQLAARGL